MNNFNIPPLWVELVAMVWFGLITFGIPFGIIIMRDYNKAAGIFLITISVLAWVYFIFRWITQ